MALPLITAALGLAEFAPSLLRFFGAGEKSVKVAEKAAGIAQAITGTASPDAALDALRQNPELALKFKLAVLEADADLEKAYLADRQDARDRDIELRKLTGGENFRADIMIVCDWLGLLACLVVLAFFRKDIPGEVVALLSTIASIFGLCLRDAHQFEFGSSRGSKDKDHALIKWADES
ncbi:MAG: hypothetical protein WEB85_02870 [Dongiaceae bacterium]